MITVRLDIEVTAERKVLIQLPPEVSSGRHEILLVVDEPEHRPAGQASRLQAFSGRINWPVDGLLFQNQLREEWK